MNKITIKQFVIFSSTLVILSGVSVFASSPAATPVCEVVGVIKSVEFKDAYEASCLQEPYGCPTDMRTGYPARYSLDVNIDSAIYISGDSGMFTCQDLYPVDSTQKIFINKDKAKIGDTFIVGQQIDGVVRSFWDKSFDSYTLKTETPTISVMESSKVSEKVLQQNHVDNVDDISLQPDQQTYKVQGTKKGKLFFLIPVRLNIQLEVDATTGAVKTIKKPWWAFLVR